MSDPFELSGPTILNVSGGRTSGYMLRRHLDAHGGELPPDCHTVFANTGRERPETLDFVAEIASRWGVEIRWIERRAKGAWVEVDYESASRDGEPFAELVDEKRYLPNAVARFCTVGLKINPAAGFMRAQGYERWTSVLGLRHDEARRVVSVRGRDHGEWDVSCPLFDARITRADVDAFWRAQPFDLALQSYEGNCDLCFLKGRLRRERIMREHPELASWWIEQEERIGGRFHAHEKGYRRTLNMVLAQGALDFGDAAADEDADTIPCTCTERRRPARCTCGKRRGQGHALGCALVMGDAREPRVIYANAPRTVRDLDKRAA